MRKKRFLNILLCVALVMTMLPTTALATSDPGTNTFDVTDGNVSISTGTEGNTLKVTYGASGAEERDNIPITAQITLTGSTSDYAVTVASGVTANITLSDVTIDHSETLACAFEMSGATVNLTLNGTNTLKSGLHAGLHAPAGSILAIGGSGSLLASKEFIASINGGDSGSYGAGIGGGSNGAAGTTVITGGSVNANGTTHRIQDIPTNGTVNGNQPLSPVEAPGIDADTQVTDLDIPSATYYGTDDLFTDSAGMLYLYVPSGLNGAQARTESMFYY